MAWGSFRAQCLKGVLRVQTITRNSCFDLFVYNNVDLDPSFRPSLENLVQPPLLVEVRRTPHEEFWTQPPIFDVDCLLGPFQSDRDGIEVVLSVDVPLDLVTITFWRERLVAVALSDASPLIVSGLLVSLIVAMVGVDNILKLPYLVLEVNRTDCGMLEMGICGDQLQLRG